MGETIGFVFEIVFLVMGIYLYLFAIGKVKSKDPDRQKRGEEWRTQNASWLRIAALALTAISLVNLLLHISEKF